METKTARRNHRRVNSCSRIVLVDDHPLVRAGLADVLRRESDLQVCGEADDRNQALEVIAATQPDLIITDLTLKNSNGLELIKDIRARFPDARILVVSMHDELLNAERALRAGASGYMTKEEATSGVVPAVRQVLRGEMYLSHNAAAHIAARLAGPDRAKSSGDLAALTDRELQVLQLIGEGLSRRQIAERLHIEVNTVEAYRARIKEKLHVQSAHELLHCAMRCRRERSPCL